MNWIVVFLVLTIPQRRRDGMVRHSAAAWMSSSSSLSSSSTFLLLSSSTIKSWERWHGDDRGRIMRPPPTYSPSLLSSLPRRTKRNTDRLLMDNDSNNNNNYNNDDDRVDDYYWEDSRKRKRRRNTQRGGATSSQAPVAPYYDDSGNDEYEDRTQQYNSNVSNGSYYDYQQQQQQQLDDQYLEWERCVVPGAGEVHVLLPPAAVPLPSAVIHFVGGTALGSAPAVWYRELLEGIVLHTQVAVIASTIPITITQSPLHHVDLARQIQRQFTVAYRDQLCREYDATQLASLPVCGMGHSLGARLLVVLATLMGAPNPNASTTTTSPPRRSSSNNNNKQRPSSSSSSSPRLYKSMILISFNNFAAATSIPGLRQLQRARQRQIQQQQGAASDRTWREQQQHQKQVRRALDQDYYDDDSDWNHNSNNNNYDDHDDGNTNRYRDSDDDDASSSSSWLGMVDEVRARLKHEAIRVRDALTPSTMELELYPTPDQLWDAIRIGNRFTVPATLIVQLDQDDMDQSSPLAQAIISCCDNNKHQVQFARLRGTHWTPVSSRSGAPYVINNKRIVRTNNNHHHHHPYHDQEQEQQLEQWWQQVQYRTKDWLTLRNAIETVTNVGRRQQRRSNNNNNNNNSNNQRREEEELKDLRRSIVRYITEIVTK